MFPYPYHFYRTLAYSEPAPVLFYPSHRYRTFACSEALQLSPIQLIATEPSHTVSSSISLLSVSSLQNLNIQRPPPALSYPFHRYRTTEPFNAYKKSSAEALLFSMHISS